MAVRAALLRPAMSIYTTVVSAGDLAHHIDHPDWVIVDCRFTLTDPEAGRRAYTQGHLPGARYAHLEDDLSAPVSPRSGRHPLPDPDVLEGKLGAWGIDSEKQVVAYDDTFGAMASRLWWLLRWLGHDRVALLDGGLPAWTRAGLPVTTEIPRVHPAHFLANPRPGMVVSAESVAASLAEDSAVLVDARAEERFSGEVEPLDPVAGHVPGAVNLPWEDNLDLDGTFLPPGDLKELYGDIIGSHSSADVIAMCGSGVTACHNLLAMEIAGISAARLYAGSWSEWITDPGRPVATGE
ncbi:MAG: sulfurtransferase [Acidiferrobacteraceae bacterium]